jgi:glycolate oxidase FAD binding subunit
MIVEPASTEEVADVLRAASRDRRRVSIRGAGTKAGWGAPPSDSSRPSDIVLSTRKLKAVLAHRHGDLTATVQAGATLADVNRTLAQHGQCIPLDPPLADRATIGGIVATNDSGPRRHRYGAPRDLIIGVDFVRADGVAAKAGGIVVKNVAGYDVARLLTGSFGSLAVVVAATFKLFPLPAASRTVVVDVAAERIDAVLSGLLASHLTPTAIELQAPAPRLLVRFETIEVAAEQQASAVARLAESAGCSASIVRAAEELTVWDDHARRPWERDGAVVKITLLPDGVGSTLAWFAAAGGAVDYEVIGRAGVGVLLARIGGDTEHQARVITGLRARLPASRGSAVLVRASDDLKARVDIWGPIGDGFALMRAIKQQFDPMGILNPGRGPGGL